MSRQYTFSDSDRQLENECFDRIETEADRAEVNYWCDLLRENANETGSHVLRMQARQHLRIFKEKRGKKCGGR